MLPVIWDGVSDPLMGWIVTHRSRLGKFRPYILFGAPLMAFSLSACLPHRSGSRSHDRRVSVNAYDLSNRLYRNSVPYSSLAAALTHDSRERGTMAGVRLMAAMIGGIVTAATMLELARFFGNGDMRQGFAGCQRLCIAVFGDDGGDFSDHIQRPRKPPKVTSRQTLSFLRHNRAFWILCGASFVGVIGSAIGGKSIVYYVNYAGPRWRF